MQDHVHVPAVPRATRARAGKTKGAIHSDARAASLVHKIAFDYYQDNSLVASELWLIQQ